MYSASRFAFLTVLLAGQLAFASAVDLTCPASNGTTSNGVQCNDNITSLGMAVIRITDPAVIAALAGSPPPGYDPTTHLFVTPLMFDQSTIIGRSAPFAGGSASDTGGVPVGVTNGGVTQLSSVGDPATLPAAFPTGNNDEIHTAILSLDLSGGGFQVQAGAGITAGTPNAGVASTGEVESIGCNSIATSTSISACPGSSDFPANSFFDVFANIVTPFGSFYNSAPLVVQNSSITSLPPVVVYTHGQSSSVPLLADSSNVFGETANEQFGTMILTGHGAGYGNTDPTSVAGGAPGPAAFGAQMLAAVAADTSLSTADQSFLDSQISVETLPEPSTIVMMLSGLGLIGWGKLRRRA